jgi:alpha-tubulin suppressor-like RCC1 family protein
MKRSLALALAALAACEGPFVPPTLPPPGPPAVAQVVVTPDSGIVITGDSLRLLVTLRDSASQVITGRSVVWQSANAAVATISSTGVVHGVTTGSTSIRASVEGHADTVTVSVIPLIYTVIVAGGLHTCAAANDGHVACWGENSEGQIGTGTGSLQEQVPQPIVGGVRFSLVAAGAAHSCAIAQFGTAYCWGRNTESQLGRGATPGNTAIPAPVASAQQFGEIAAGGTHTCALGSDGFTYCWGLNANGQLGDGGKQPRTTPHHVIDDLGFSGLTAGVAHTCAIANASAAAYCWGGNAGGALGDGTRTDRDIPTLVAGGLGFMQIAAGSGHTCAVAGSGQAYCWGGNAFHQLGSGLDSAVLTTPHVVTGGLTFRLVAGGGSHTCGLSADSLAYCWGKNDAGQLGDSSTTERPAPTAVRGGRKFADIRAGSTHTCAITGTLVVFCWGDGSRGQLGRGSPQPSLVPVKVAGQP